MVKHAKVLRIVGDVIVDGPRVYKVCTCCHAKKPLDKFGFRQMKPDEPDTLYVQPRCTTCRGIRPNKRHGKQPELPLKQRIGKGLARALGRGRAVQQPLFKS